MNHKPNIWFSDTTEETWILEKTVAMTYISFHAGTSGPTQSGMTIWINWSTLSGDGYYTRLAFVKIINWVHYRVARLISNYILALVIGEHSQITGCNWKIFPSQLHYAMLAPSILKEDQTKETLTDLLIYLVNKSNAQMIG